MRLQVRILCLITALAGLAEANGQGVPIGYWRDHLPYNQCIYVTETSTQIICATSHSLFAYNKADYTIERISKINGLSDLGISHIDYHAPLQTLVVAYANTKIDLITPKGIFNMGDIWRKTIPGNKVINRVVIIGKRAYLACGFGIVVLDIEKREIADTWYIGPGGTALNVNDIALSLPDSTIYAATDNGLYKASFSSSNLANFAQWNRENLIPNTGQPFSEVETIGNFLIANRRGAANNDDALFLFTGNNWAPWQSSETQKVTRVRASRNKLLVTRLNKISVYSSNLTLSETIQTYRFGNPSPNDALYSSDGILYIADVQSGLVKYVSSSQAESIQPDGPPITSVYSMASAGNNVYTVPGGRNSSWVNLFQNAMVNGFVDNKWVSYNQWNTSGFGGVQDVLCLAVDPADNQRLMAGSWGMGILEINKGLVTKRYDHTNSTLQSSIFLQGWVCIGGLAFDEKRNLWATNSSAPNLLSVMKPDGSWRSFSLNPVASGIDFGGLLIDQSGQKWCLVRNHGLVVFNDNNTIDNVADDKVKRLSGAVGNGALPGSLILCLAVDLDGQLWMGTNEGVAVIRSPENVFSTSNFDAYKPIVVEGGHAQYLLKEETVTAIAVDGANRKWFGTDRAGVFLMTPDGTKQILNFNEENSPILSNTITSITIDKKGEVFFGTSKGVISYRAEATFAQPEQNDVLVYPNPVRPGYMGAIAIKGLWRDSEVRITDIGGNLVYKTRAFGGQAVWNGTNHDGRRASSGVYLVFASDQQGTKTLVAKILFMQ